jgi:hypothetical protein
MRTLSAAALLRITFSAVHDTSLEVLMKRNLRNLLVSTLAFLGASALTLGTSPKSALASSRSNPGFEKCNWGGLPLWCAPGVETDLCDGGNGAWYYGCLNNGGAS